MSRASDATAEEPLHPTPPLAPAPTPADGAHSKEADVEKAAPERVVTYSSGTLWTLTVLFALSFCLAGAAIGGVFQGWLIPHDADYDEVLTYGAIGYCFIPYWAESGRVCRLYTDDRSDCDNGSEVECVPEGMLGFAFAITLFSSLAYLVGAIASVRFMRQLKHGPPLVASTSGLKRTDWLLYAAIGGAGCSWLTFVNVTGMIAVLAIFGMSPKVYPSWAWALATASGVTGLLALYWTVQYVRNPLLPKRGETSATAAVKVSD